MGDREDLAETALELAELTEKQACLISKLSKLLLQHISSEELEEIRNGL